MLFCNVGWMNRYEGLHEETDEIVGGGKWVDENKSGHEVCNFLACQDGYVYGHVETVKGGKDRQIRLERLGGTGDSIEGIDVIWTASHPQEGGRRVVGWYRNATVFRERQHFAKAPSKQHERDNIETFRIRALASDAYRLEPEERSLAMGRGKGWMGHTPWWIPSEDSPEAVQHFVRQVRALMDSPPMADPRVRGSRTAGGNSAGAAADPHVRYLQACEICIPPRHNELQEKFRSFIFRNGGTDLRQNIARVDLRYCDSQRGSILVEVKSCDAENARYAIRTAMGQLLVVSPGVV